MVQPQLFRAGQVAGVPEGEPAFLIANAEVGGVQPTGLPSG